MRQSFRKLFDLKDVLKNPESAVEDRIVYTMNRGIFKRNGYRYDETIIPPLLVGDEYIKTKGHSHLCPEMYVVLEGKAIFLMQDNKTARAIFAKKDDMVVIPPRWWHVTINPSRESLKLGDWIAEMESNYSLFEKTRGAAHYYTTKGWVKNKNFKIPLVTWNTK